MVIRIPLYLEEDAHSRVGLDVVCRKGPIGCAEPDVAIQVDEVERIDARPTVAGKGSDAGDHGPLYDVEAQRNYQFSSLTSRSNP